MSQDGNPTYYVRECRGHYHVCFNLADGECCDLALRGDLTIPGQGSDCFSEVRAREIAAILNSDPTRIEDF